MAKRRIIWSVESSMDLFEIMDFYNDKNKSKIYSRKLYKAIQLKLKTIDFTIALPQKTSDKKLFYFTINHIFVGFDIIENDINVLIVIDDRRNPQLIQKIISTV